MFVSALIFIISSILMIFAGKWVINSISSLARFLQWKEFVVAFFALSLGAVAPEFFIGIFSALHGIPELSLGNIIGQNVLLLSLAVAVSAFLLKDGIKIESRTVKTGSVFAVVASILPLILLLDGELSRIDGIVLILAFVIFATWLFSKKEYFTKIYSDSESPNELIKGFKEVSRVILLLIIGLIFIVISAEGIIASSLSFSSILGLSIPFVGLLIVALGTGLPEIYISARLALQGQSWMILGGLMGAVAMSSTLVLGIVTLIEPIILNVSELPHLALARVFLLMCALLFLFFTRTDKTLSGQEALVLLALYITFVVLSFVLV